MKQPGFFCTEKNRTPLLMVSMRSFPAITPIFINTAGIFLKPVCFLYVIVPVRVQQLQFQSVR
jgi:hypothetical protein